MQMLPVEIISQAREEKMKKLDKGLRELIEGSVKGERVICPICQYTSKKNKTSAIIFENSIKCFSCGIWRKI